MLSLATPEHYESKFAPEEEAETPPQKERIIWTNHRFLIRELFREGRGVTPRTYEKSGKKLPGGPSYQWYELPATKVVNELNLHVASACCTMYMLLASCTSSKKNKLTIHPASANDTLGWPFNLSLHITPPLAVLQPTLPETNSKFAPENRPKRPK